MEANDALKDRSESDTDTVPAMHFAANPPAPFSIAIARNVRRNRERRSMTPEQLAARACVPIETVMDVESARGEPSIGLAWRLAHALGVPFAALTADQAPRGTVLMRRDRAPVLSSDRYGLTSRALFPSEATSRIEFFELNLAPQHAEWYQPHAWGTHEILYVGQGSVEVTVGREPVYCLESGDSVYFPADLTHTLRNNGKAPAVLYQLITYQHYAAVEDDLGPNGLGR